MIKRICALACVTLAAAASQAAVIWYGGDFDGRNAAPNEINGLLNDARTYDDFTLSSPATLASVWSNNLFDTFTATTAQVEIRTGVSQANGGTVVFSGTFAASVTATGRTGFGMNEMQVRVSGLSVALGAGTYYLSVTPVGNGAGRAFVSSCAGANGVGVPLANGNSFVNSPDLVMFFESTTYLGPGNWDFSMGVESATGALDFFPASLTPIRGNLVSGNLASLLASDNNRLVYRPSVVLSNQLAPVSYELVGTAPQQTASSLRFRIESHASSSSISQKIEMYDYIAGAFVTIDTRNLTTTDNLIEAVISTNASRYIQAGTRQTRTRIEFRATGPTLGFPWESRVDLAMWRLNP